MASNKKRITQWDDGWHQNLKDLISSGSITALDPKYYRGSDHFRFKKSFIKSDNKHLDYTFFKVLRLWIFHEYIKEYSHVYEFGCGPSHNLVTLGNIYPEKVLFGFDWAKSSIEIINILKEKHFYKISGHIFNFFSPNYKINFNKNSILLTIGGLEQIGSMYNNFLEFILKKKPKRVIHIEPIIEFYDKNSLVDNLAILYHKKRNYLNGYYTTLLNIEKKGMIKLQKSHRVEFGGLYHDGWSIIIFDIIK